MSAAENATDHWDHKDQWRKHGKNFLIVVERFNGRPDADDGTGPNRWAVYAYIYPKHPHFAAFEGPRMWQEAATCLPLHAYPSYLEYPMYDGKVTSVKVGADYHHLHDTEYSHYATKEDASQVFADAERLFVWLQQRSEPNVPVAEAGATC